MLILTIRTDKPESEIGLYEDADQTAYIIWEAHRSLAETIHIKIKDLLESKNKNLQDVKAILVFKGPGSFTGLRIGITVANALSEGINVPVVAAQNEDWIDNGIKRLLAGENDNQVSPEYGAPVHITTPKK